VPFCPRGHGEYQSWVTACAECGAPLTDQPPPIREVVVGRYPSEIEAGMWAEVLERGGIAAVVAAVGPGTAYHGPAGAPRELRVRADDAARARELLESLGPG
jgi:hypothetical protein